jgi:hypothetical protein
VASDERSDHRQVADLSSSDRFVGNVKSAFGARWRTVLGEGIRAIPEFGQFLLTELRHSGQQYVCACLTLADARRLNSEERISLMNAMMHEKRGELLGRLCDGFTWRDAGLKALAKLNTTESRRADYVRLGGYLRQPTTAKVLAHAQYLSPAILHAIWELPDWICLSNLLPLFEEPDAVAAIKATFKTHLWDLSAPLEGTPDVQNDPVAVPSADFDAVATDLVGGTMNRQENSGHAVETRSRALHPRSRTRPLSSVAASEVLRESLQEHSPALHSSAFQRSYSTVR